MHSVGFFSSTTTLLLWTPLLNVCVRCCSLFIRRHRFGLHCIWQRRVRWCWAPPPPAGSLVLPIAGQHLPADPATAPMHDSVVGRWTHGHVGCGWYDRWYVLCRRLPDDGPDASRVPCSRAPAQPAPSGTEPTAGREGGADLVLASSRCLRPTDRLLPFRLLRSHAPPTHCGGGGGSGGGGVLHFTQSHGSLPQQHGFRRVDPTSSCILSFFLFCLNHLAFLLPGIFQIHRRIDVHDPTAPFL